MAELEAIWAGMVQTRSHWYIVRYRELGLAISPTLLPPRGTMVSYHSLMWCLGLSASSRPQESLSSLPIPAAWSCPLDPVVMGTFCQAYCTHYLWCKNIRQLGGLDMNLPALCVCYSYTQSGKPHILSIVNWESCTMSTVRIGTKSCELQLVKYPWALLVFGIHCSAVCWVWHGNTATIGTKRRQSNVWFLPPHLLTCQPNGLTGQYCEGEQAHRFLVKYCTKQSIQTPAGRKQTENRASLIQFYL